LALAGLLFATSAGMGLFILSKMLEDAPPANAVLVVMPRLAFYVINVAFWPYGVQRIIRDEPAELRRSLWVFLGIWLLLGCGVLAGLYGLIRRGF
jgi:hypothetical protein